MATQRTRTVYIGSYTPDSSGAGTGVGISRYEADPATGALAPAGDPTPVSGPSFLAAHPTGRWLYATGEAPDGVVHAFAVEPDGALRALGDRPTGGADPCHLSVDPTGRWLVTANYTSGSVAVHPIGPDGALGERSTLLAHEGGGPDPDRQEGPHCHQARFDPAGRHLLVNDLGNDTVTTYRLVDGGLVTVASARVPAGTGPRHLAFGAGERVYLAGELGSTVGSFRYDAESGELTPLTTVAASATAPADNFPSEIACSPDGSRVYVANRGANSVAVFDADLAPLGETPSGGQWPRHLALVGDHLYVANQNSGTVAVFRTGTSLTPVGSLDVPSPACVLPW